MDGGDSRGDVAERICHELKRIADALERLTVEAACPSETTAPEICACIPADPIQAGATSWVCGLCRQPCLPPDPETPA